MDTPTRFALDDLRKELEALKARLDKLEGKKSSVPEKD